MALLAKPGYYLDHWLTETEKKIREQHQPGCACAVCRA
jgi:hypothetical protein